MDLLTIDRDWDARQVRSSFWRLYVNSRPGARVVLEGGEHRVTPGWVHLVPAWVRFSCVNDRPVEHLYLHFDLAGLPGPLVRDIFHTAVALPAGSEAFRLAQTLRDALRRPEAGRLSAVCVAKSLAYLAFAEALAAVAPAERERCERFLHQPQAVAPALRHIEAHLAEPLANAYLARCCALSEDHFIRVFRTLVGQTPAQYVLERRIAVAAQRLAYTADSIEQVAHGVGFANRFHFTAAFTRRMGVSPAAYRAAPRA